MSKRIVVGIVVVAALGVAAWFVWRGEMITPAMPTGNVRLNADLYPLYPGARWGEPQAGQGPGSLGVAIESQPFAGITDIGADALPFEHYYEEKLAALGWERDLSREAGGPGASQSVYTKGADTIIVSFHSQFLVTHEDAPSECPCDLTLGLLSY